MTHKIGNMVTINDERLPLNFKEHHGDTLMSNFDGLVNEEIANEIKGKELFSGYAGWNFNDKVWWDGEQWNCEVWRYHSYRDTYSAAELSEIMHAISEVYGYD